MILFGSIVKAARPDPQSHLNRLEVEDFLGLHQRTEGEHVFPLEVVALLSKPGEESEVENSG